MTIPHSSTDYNRPLPLAEMVKKEYRDYQIYTLMDRAIPYLQDGLKPSQRRILYTLYKQQHKGLTKVSSVTGLVLTLHPHGPQSIEAAIVNLAQDFTFANNYPLIDKKGYFGERMEPEPAASRYIECQLGEVAKLLLFDDTNQWQMIPNYDERATEPLALLPKLPLMLLNGSEGIGTGFSSNIPSFHHQDIIHSMIYFLEKGKPRKLNPWVRYYTEKIKVEPSGKIIFPMGLKEKNGRWFITELPKGTDAQKIYKHLNRLMDEDFIKDYIDSSVDNIIDIELMFKRGVQPTADEIHSHVFTQSSLVPNYTLISERGVKIFAQAEEIIEIFTGQRLAVVKRRYELLVSETTTELKKNNEIIRFIKEKHYTVAEKSRNRQGFVDYLKTKDFHFAEYLVEMAIYRMTLEEVQKRQLLIDEDTKKLSHYRLVLASPERIRDKLIDELNEVGQKLEKIMAAKENQKKEVFKKAVQAPKIKS